MNSLYRSGLCEVPIYSHFFSLDLYEVYTTKLAGCSDIFYCLNGVRCSVTATSSNDLYKKFLSITNLPYVNSSTNIGVLCPNSNVRKCEITQTALLVRELDHFIFANEPVCNFACLHQLPVYSMGKAIEQPDFHIIGFDEQHKPTSPVLLGDYKPTNFHRAREETIAYVIRAR